MANRSSFRDLDTEARTELGARIGVMVEACESQMAAAEFAQVSPRQLRMYVAGETAPSFLAVTRLATEVGFSLDWVVTGKGPRKRTGGSGTTNPATHPPPIDSRFFGRIVGAIGKAYKEAGAVIDCDTLGTLAADEYSAVAALASSEDEQIAIAKMVKSKHLHRLSTESMASRKRRA